MDLYVLNLKLFQNIFKLLVSYLIFYIFYLFKLVLGIL